LPTADRERAGQKFSDDGSEGHVSVEHIDSRLRLIHAAAASAGKESLHQKSDHQPGSCWHQQNPHGCWRRSQQAETNPFDSHAKTNHRQSREDSNRDGQQQE
jgi:hypothetical protein